jgi:hypothetical protein
MKPENFKSLRGELQIAFRNLLANCYTDFKEVDITHAKGQVFTINMFYGEEYNNKEGLPLREYDTNIIRPIIHFQALGLWANESFNINNFFDIDDQILAEFAELAERQEFDILIKIFKNALTYAVPKDVGQHTVQTYFFVSLESNVCGGDLFQQSLLEEGIAVISLNETTGRINVDCTQNERKKVEVVIEGNPVTLQVPFDKLDNLKLYQPKSEKNLIDEKYIFVAMSFQSDPALEDAYSTIKRTVKNLKKGLRCERVDDIQDDFVIDEKIYSCIQKSKLLIVDLTGSRPNVYYELGYARALGKQIILTAKTGEKPHFDVSHQNTIFYNNSTELEKALNARLRAIFHK